MKDEEFITPEELKENRKDLYSGMKLRVYNHRTGKVEEAKIERFYTHVIVCDNNCSYTMVEYAMYKRNPNRVMGKPAKNYGHIM